MANIKHKKRLSASSWKRRSNIRKDIFRKWRNLNLKGEVSEGMEEHLRTFMVRKF